MADFFGFNPKAMSNEQLIERFNDLMLKISIASRMGGSCGTEMMYDMVNAIDAERRERMFLESWKMAAPYISRPIETDPDLRATENKETTDESKKQSKRRTPRHQLPPRTAQPVTPQTSQPTMSENGPSK